MAKQAPLRCGVAGVGYLGQHHARIYGALKQTELVGVYDVSAKRAREVAKEHGGEVFDSIEALGEACDAVSVVTPTDLHHDVAIPLLERNCHLLIEKPITPTLEEAESIMQKAKEKGRIVQVGHIEHFNPVMAFLEKNVTDPRFITCDRLAPFKKRGIEVGVVLDLMIHDIGVILQLVKSPIARIDSVGVNVMTKTEDIANTRIAFENGCVANINTSRVSRKAVREIRVFQPNAYLSLNFAEQKGHLIRKGKLGLSKKDIPIEKGEPLMLELASFADAIQSQSNPKVDARLGATALEIAIQVTEQIRASM
ncbi:Gfo/Idh/MocA family oxidoreductase [Rubellicoccus peritrichatus]|uniref:Gfo/Idh/MocA family oxidoreductase n=1 Tax=Rubellicoccus peritrichatus TaxID=3080537 RepID=A0AAQ3QSR9_9BACT|nr:Gfo/Idh/MocA family oxidoreductase [Puniceicoccus sp. CR14]WOO40576.1 Gfo/Idh/MocA family oxidoreductase [Puniceicoccus sp. CR14]